MPDPTKGPDPSRAARGELSPQERAEFERRVADLDHRLDKAEAGKRGAAPPGNARRSGRGMAYGLRMATELVAAVLVGGLIGYGLDAFLGSKPWLFLIFFLIGFAAGIMNLLRAYRKMQAQITAETGGYLGERVDDDED